MAEIGLFPLDIVLLPGERIPLHVFEDRYKELIGECIERRAAFGLILADDEGMRSVGTRALVEAVLERFDDGRMNILVRGERRFSVAALTEGRSFATAHVEDYPDHEAAEEPTASERQACLDAFRSLATAAEVEPDTSDARATGLAFDLAGRIAFATGPKQELLEMRAERPRLLRLIELMDEARQALDRRSAIRKRAAGNGHVQPR